LDTPEQIADKLNTLTEKVDIKVIKGLEKWLARLGKSIREKGGGQISGGGSIVEAEDLSSQCDGANKTFTVDYPVKKVIALTCSQFPIILRRNVDYTFSGKTITLTAEVSAPESGQTLDISYTR
jgi:methylmalonyl-CoA mutase cobalamin-binding subunit